MILGISGCESKGEILKEVKPLYEGDYTTVVPAYDDSYFSNPNMGWIYYEYAIEYGYEKLGYNTKEERLAFMEEVNELLGDTVNDVTIMSAWSEIEKEPDVFDWSIYDEAVQFWVSKGKSIHLRFISDNCMFYDRGISAPDWLNTEFGVPFIKKMNDGVENSFPDYNHPKYQERLKIMMEEFANKYKDLPQLKVVDLRGYGMWGEWHSGYNYATLEERRSALNNIIDVWANVFGKDVTLAISVSPETSSISPYFNSAMPLEEYVKFSSWDHALTYENITFRRDGIDGVGSFIYSTQDGEMLTKYWESGRRQPLDYETVWFDANEIGNQEIQDKLLNEIDEAKFYHGTYMSLPGHDWPAVEPCLTDYRYIINAGLHGLGYRFKINEVTYPTYAAKGEKISIYHEWENLNYGISSVQYPLSLVLIDEGGKEVFRSEPVADFDTTVMRNGNIYKYFSQVQLPQNIADGRYKMALVLVNPLADGRGKTIRIANEGYDAEGRVVLGDIAIGESANFCFSSTAYEDFEGTEYLLSPENGASVEEVGIYGIHGKALVGESAADGIFFSLNQKMEKNSVYEVNLQYRILETSKDQYGFVNPFEIVAEEGEKCIAKQIISGDPGNEGCMTLYINTKEEDVTIRGKIIGGGKIAVDNFRINKKSASVYDFEDSDSVEILQASALVTDRKNMTIDESKALYLMKNAGNEDQDLAAMKIDVQGKNCQIAFKARSASKNSVGGLYYVKVMCGSEEIKRFDWTDDLMKEGEFVDFCFGFSTSENSEYSLVFGIQGFGKCVYDDLCVISNG